MTQIDGWMLAATWATAVGTIAVAASAVFGDTIRRWVYAPKLDISFDGLKSDKPTPRGGPNAPSGYGWYFHVRVKNTKKNTTARRVRVLIVAIEEIKNDSAKIPSSIPIPLQLRWTPAELRQLFVDFSDSAYADLVAIVKESDSNPRLELLSITQPFGLSEQIPQRGRIRYWLRVESENAASAPLVAFDVTWDGAWSDNRNDFSRHIQIEQVKTATPPATLLG
jgi:hypothetical protein